MPLKLNNVSWEGPRHEDFSTLERLPEEYKDTLELINGFIQFGGGLHVRGVCREPEWHSLDYVWSGPLALHTFYPALTEGDVPFGQDMLGDQFILRDEQVHRLYAETGGLEPLGVSFYDFLTHAQRNPIDYLQLHPLAQFVHERGTLEPGQLLSAYPPFCTKESEAGVSLKAVPALERLRFLADFYGQIKDLPEGSVIQATTVIP